MEPKYKINYHNVVYYKGQFLYQIEALRSFYSNGKYIEKGHLGGYVDSPSCLTQDGDCWIDEGSFALNDAYICEDAYVGGFSIIDGATVYGHAEINNGVILRENISVGGTAQLYGRFELSGTLNIQSGLITSNDNDERLE